ncbi:6-carboxy-5,6,7,8-tetrahydropterin synthase [uncultured Desulfobacterium sp.]|uniref:6-carboxy-5,6,7,8-tetrahydropterin synthase n=1 Tax=uncultured Desulfobacterium sp. TaxID=201089 RepID=A0A445MRH0_9BACT|nr:6-carboxy-5,6,7,8-tetrahydropterin synthase [uncultured Desulfobacterium sp.]
MYELEIISHFAAAHQLRGFEGGCENLHGHNWKVEVYVSGNKLEENGLLIDFKIIKAHTEKLLDSLDHKFLNELEPFSILNPSSENIACHLFRSLSGQLNTSNIKVSRVRVWESETACACYSEP